MVRSICVGLAVLLLSTVAVSAQDGGLPDGVTSVQEVYQDWRVNCVQGEAAICSMSQEQMQNSQRLLAIELTSNADGSASGTLLLPFGLELSAGAVLQIDDAPPHPTSTFKTCLPAGCLVQLNFDQANVEALAMGKLLTVQVVASDNGQPSSIGVSLNGFAAALARVAALTA